MKFSYFSHESNFKVSFSGILNSTSSLGYYLNITIGMETTLIHKGYVQIHWIHNSYIEKKPLSTETH